MDAIASFLCRRIDPFRRVCSSKIPLYEQPTAAVSADEDVSITVEITRVRELLMASEVVDIDPKSVSIVQSAEPVSAELTKQPSKGSALQAKAAAQLLQVYNRGNEVTSRLCRSVFSWTRLRISLARSSCLH